MRSLNFLYLPNRNIKILIKKKSSEPKILAYKNMRDDHLGIFICSLPAILQVPDTKHRKSGILYVMIQMIV